MNIYQILITVFLIIGFFATIYWDIEGRAAREPAGFKGVVVTIILYAVIFLLYYKAGLFSTLAL